jgi:hypothetical protein
MQESSRRQILRGMAAVSVLPALSLLKTSTVREPGGVPTKADTPAPSQTLAVVFHGLFAFLFGNEGDEIQVVVPVVDDHKYWAGNHGQEDRHKLRSGKNYRLSGVGRGKWSKKFDFPFLPNILALDPSTIYCQISIPWPDCLMFDRQAKRSNGEDFFKAPSNLKPAQLPTIYAFLYNDTTIVCRPELKGTLWKAPRTMGQPGKTINANLHIRAEHCKGTNMANGWDTFSDLFKLKGDDRLVLNRDFEVSGANGIGKTVPADQDDFLTEEKKCKVQGMVIQNSAVNCASIGGCKPGMVC